MCRGCGVRHNSMVQDGIPAQVQNVTRQAQLSSLPIALGLQSPAKFEPIRGFAMKEFEEQMTMLKKDNFSLKLRIYFLEEQMGKKDFNPESNADIYNALELKAEAEALKDELKGKEELLSQASEALSGLEQQFQNQVEEITNNNEREKRELKEQIHDLQNEVDEFWSHTTHDESSESVEPELMNLCHTDSIGGLSDLCDLAFNTTAEDSIPDNEPDKAHFALPLTIQETTTINPFNNPAPLKGLFSIVDNPETQHHNSLLQQDMLHQVSCLEKNLSLKDVSRDAATVRVLERQVAMLENQVMELEEELAGKEDQSFIIQGDLVNLKKEIEDKTEEVVNLQVEILDKDMKMENLSNEVHTCNKMIEENELQIHKLCEDLHNVEPEMEVTIQKIVERDRIIEGKIEQIEAQNKIIVEIQITLDEKQKQISELEGNLMHTQQQLSSAANQLGDQMKDNKVVIAELQIKEDEVFQLKDNLKKQERNILRLVAELKESMDMLNKVQWEAQNCTADDSITDMAQEENEKLWAEMEQTKLEMAKLQNYHEQTLTKAQNTINELQKDLQEECNKLHIIKEEHKKEMSEYEDSSDKKTKELLRIESEIGELTNKISQRDQVLENNINFTTYLKEQLSEARCVINKLNDQINAITNHTAVAEKMLPAVNKEHIDVCNYSIGGHTNYFSIQANEMDKMHAIRNSSEISQHTLLLNDYSNNATVLQNGKTLLTVDSIPISVNTSTSNSQLLTTLHREMNEIRKDTQILRFERKSLTEKVLDLQNQMKQHFKVDNEIEYQESENEVKNEISEESKQKLYEIKSSTNSHLTKLSQELQNVKERINCQFKEVHLHSNQEIVANFQEEILALRKQLTASNEECQQLRSHFEDISNCIPEVVSQEEENMAYKSMPVGNIIQDNSEMKQMISPLNVPCVDTSIEMESLAEVYYHSESEEEEEMLLGDSDLKRANSPATSTDTSDFIMLTPLLKDIKSLCQKLEEATNKNDILKEQLQNAMISNYNNNYIHPEFIPEYQAKIDELSQTKSQLEESNALLVVTSQQADILKQQCQVHLSHTEGMEAELNGAYKTIQDQIAELEEKEILLRKVKQILEEKETLLNETSIQITSNNEIIQGLSDEIEYLQKVACEKGDLEEQVSVLQYSLQTCESRLLQVNKERLAQVTEHKQQNAQILALSIQIQALEEEQSLSKEIIDKNIMLTKQLENEKLKTSNLFQEKESLIESKILLEDRISCDKQTLEENAVLVKQLENEREALDLIQQEKKYLISDKLKLQKDMQKIQNELKNIDDCAYHIQAQHSNDLQRYHIQQHNYQILREKHMKLQQTHSELQMKADQLENELLFQRKQQKQLEMNQQQIDNNEAHIIQLTKQVETERLLTNNLRKQLETIRSQNSNNTVHNSNKIHEAQSQHSEENTISEISTSDVSGNTQKASCLSQKGTKNKKRKVHWSDENNCNQKEGFDCCKENTEYTLERETKSPQIMRNDNQPETGARSKFSLNDLDMNSSSEMQMSTISSCSSSVWKKAKRKPFPVFISNGQYG